MVTPLDVIAENNFGDTRSGGLAGPMGLLIIVLLAIATVLLIRNMNARLRRLPDRFPDQQAPSADSADSADTADHADTAHRADRAGRQPADPNGTATSGGSGTHP